MSKLCALYLILICLLPNCLLAGPMKDISDQESLEEYLVNGHFNGLILVAHDNITVMKKAFGFKDVNNKVPLKLADKFQIGSNTKQFVAAAILKLQQEDRLSIDDGIDKYFPQYSNFKNIKLRDILNHTSGVINFTDKEEFWKLKPNNIPFSLQEIIDFAAQYPLDFIPRSQWNYSNTGYILAGKILEIVSGESWDAYLQKNFLQPLKMSNTGYELEFANVSDVVGHVMQDDKLVPIHDFNLSWAASAGALYSTLDDLLNWTAIYAESSILSEKSKLEMQTPFLNSYALGIFSSPYKDESLFSHSGRTPGFTSNIQYLNKSKYKVIILSNAETEIGSIAGYLLDYFVNGKVVVLKTQLYPVNLEQIKNYIGIYSLGKLDIKVEIKDSKLYLQPLDGKQPAYLLRPVDKDSFTIPGISGEEFVFDQQGNISGLKHFQNGKVSFAAKKAEF